MLDEFLIPSGPDVVEFLLATIPEGRGFSQCLIEAAEPLDGLALAMTCVLRGLVMPSGPAAGSALVILTQSPAKREGAAGQWVWRGAAPATVGRPGPGVPEAPEAAQMFSGQPASADAAAVVSDAAPTAEAGDGQEYQGVVSPVLSPAPSAMNDQVMSGPRDLLLSDLGVSETSGSDRGRPGASSAGSGGPAPGASGLASAAFSAPRDSAGGLQGGMLGAPGKVKLPINWFWSSPSLEPYRSQVLLHYAPTYPALCDLLSCRWPDAVKTVVLCDLADCSREYAAPHCGRLEASLLAVLRARAAKSLIVTTSRTSTAASAPGCGAHLRVGAPQQPYGLRSLWARYRSPSVHKESPELLVRPDSGGFMLCVGVRSPRVAAHGREEGDVGEEDGVGQEQRVYR